MHDRMDYDNYCGEKNLSPLQAKQMMSGDSEN